jgi:hypothetical protein
MDAINGQQSAWALSNKKYGKNQVIVKVPIHKKNFSRYCELAVQAKKRRGGLQLYTQKPHGFANEVSPNTDGLAKFMKFCVEYYQQHEAERLEAQARLIKEEQDIAERKKKLGLI